MAKTGPARRAGTAGEPAAEAPGDERLLAHARRLGVRVRSTLSLAERVEAGLAFESFERLQRALGLGQAETAELVRIRPRTLARRRETGRLEPGESERVLRAARVFEAALALFEGDAEGARRWLTTVRRALGGRTPLAVMRSEPGAREVERLLERLEHGVFG